MLVGTSNYRILDPIDAVRNNLTDLAQQLCGRTAWALPPENCIIVKDPTTITGMLDPVAEAARDATDTLLVYFAGHGLIDSRRGQLHLTHTWSDPNRFYTAVPYDHLRDLLLDGQAVRRVVILDCCYSGRALGQMSDFASTIINEMAAEGTYIMTAAAENKAALALPGERYTAFTAELLNVLENGIDGQGELLDLDAIYNQLRLSMLEKSLPIPQKRDRNLAGHLALVRNRAFNKSSDWSVRYQLADLEESLTLDWPLPFPSTRPNEVLGLLDGRYQINKLIGRGSSAEVYRAVDTRLGRVVAVKTLAGSLAGDLIFRERLQREARSIASLNHPSIVAVHDTGEATMNYVVVPYIVIEYIDGLTLREVLDSVYKLPAERAFAIVSVILRALDYSHRHGIVHRHIKPSNIMITRSGKVKVTDFGLARAITGSQATMTQTAQVLGTAEYLSPEQARGERIDALTDIYSIGCVLYELLTGQPPFTGDSPVAIAYQQVCEDPVPPSQRNSDLPPWTDTIVLRAMAKSPLARYQSAADMQTDIGRAFLGLPTGQVDSSSSYDSMHSERQVRRRWRHSKP